MGKDEVPGSIPDPVAKKDHFLPGMFDLLRFESIPELGIFIFQSYLKIPGSNVQLT